MKFFQKYKPLGPSLLFTLCMVAGRVAHTYSLYFLFLLWNLFLALVPLYISDKMPAIRSKRMSWLCAALWLLFFPNSVYIITDIFHLNQSGDMPQWYDLLLLFSAAINGLFMGLCSLANMERWMIAMGWARKVRSVIFILLLLCGYGIYLGRYLRWNSWDIIASPLSLLLDIKADIFHPRRNAESWLLTGLFGTWLYIVYSFFGRGKSQSENKQVTLQ